MTQTATPAVLVGGIGGLITGYVLWLVGISIGDDFATVSVWSMTALMASGALTVCALLWGLVQRRRRRYLGSAFAFGLPILPVLLSLAVLADIYF